MGGRLIKALKFVDNQMTMAKSPEVLQRMKDCSIFTFDRMCYANKYQKTKIMKMSRKEKNGHKNNNHLVRR